MEKLQNKLGYQFRNLSLLKTALRHKSCGADNNERLEFLGDSILNFVAADLIFEMFVRLPEGNMSRVRAELVKEQTLAREAEKWGLPSLLLMIANDQKKTNRNAVLADAIEAVFGAVHLDGGFEAARRVIRKYLMNALESGEVSFRKDPKTALQELLQGKGLPLPVYEMIGKLNRAEANIEVSCRIASLQISTTARGASRKEAESLAARIALEACKQKK